MDQALIFMRTKVECDHLEDFLRALGGNKKGPVEGEYSCASLHGDRSVNERKVFIIFMFSFFVSFSLYLVRKIFVNSKMAKCDFCYALMWPHVVLI